MVSNLITLQINLSFFSFQDLNRLKLQLHSLESDSCKDDRCRKLLESLILIRSWPCIYTNRTNQILSLRISIRSENLNPKLDEQKKGNRDPINQHRMKTSTIIEEVKIWWRRKDQNEEIRREEIGSERFLWPPLVPGERKERWNKKQEKITRIELYANAGSRQNHP